ncbi:MAG: DUF4267 domain-containing protein [Ferruginibacter sp.]|nr:DUF4267 domain-containing protein [Cytophagales bacterium]
MQINSSLRATFGLGALIGLGLLFIGGRFWLAPEAGEQGFGIAVNEAGNYAFHRIKGVRDFSTGLLLVTFSLLQWKKPLGILLLVGSLIPAADAFIVWSSPGSNSSAMWIHGLTFLTSGGLAYFLLKGPDSGEPAPGKQPVTENAPRKG